MARICLINMDISTLGGAQNVTAKLAKEFSRFCEVHVLSIKRQNHDTAYIFPENVFITYLASVGEDKKLRSCIKHAYYPIINYIRECSIDIVFLIGGYAAASAILTKRRTNAIYVYCDHTSFGNWKDFKDLCIRFFCCKWADMIVVLTKRSMDDYLHRFRICKNKITCIYNWIDDDMLDTRRKYSYQSKIIITVGRLSPEKGIDLLVRIAEKVLPQLPGWEWHVYGDGSLLYVLQSNIKTANLESQLILKGCCSNMAQVYGCASFVVLPSYREGLPLVLLEARAYMLPAIAFDINTGPREILADNINGYLVPPYDVDKMASKIVYLAKNENVRKQLSSHSYDNISEFSQTRILGQWKTLIEQLCDKSMCSQ